MQHNLSYCPLWRGSPTKSVERKLNNRPLKKSNYLTMVREKEIIINNCI